MKDNQIELFAPKPYKGLTCRSCAHRFKHEYAKTFYCKAQASTRTSNGHLKIKAGDKACVQYSKA